MKFQFLVPTYNDLVATEYTIKSIYAQSYSPDNYYVTIMDFGSDKEIYEEYLYWNYSNLGIYREPFTTASVMISKMAKILDRLWEYKHVDYYVVLYPGNIIDKYFLEVCERRIREQEGTVDCVVCETRIIDRTNAIVCQNAIYDRVVLIDGKTHLSEYFRGGTYNHQVQCMVNTLYSDNLRRSSERNELLWWNKCFLSNEFKNTLYIPDVLAEQKQIFYDDELEEILLRWEAVINYERVKTTSGQSVQEGFIDRALNAIARYALWRSELYLDIDKKVAEDCFLITSVIWPNIENTLEYCSQKEKLGRL